MITSHTTKQAGAILGVTAHTVFQLIRSGRIKATRKGRDWLIEDADLQEYIKDRRRPGRPCIHGRRSKFRTRQKPQPSPATESRPTPANAL